MMSCSLSWRHSHGACISGFGVFFLVYRNSCAPDGKPGTCGTHNGAKCTGPSVRCCFGADVTGLEPYYDIGSRVTLNYMAAYSFDSATAVWNVVPDSSFNTDGQYVIQYSYESCCIALHRTMSDTKMVTRETTASAQSWSSGCLGGLLLLTVHSRTSSFFPPPYRYPPYNLTEDYGGLPKEQAWLAPQPGGAVFWALGYYPAGVHGVGGDGIMFVLSAEEW